MLITRKRLLNAERGDTLIDRFSNSIRIISVLQLGDGILEVIIDRDGSVDIYDYKDGIFQNQKGENIEALSHPSARLEKNIEEGHMV